MYMHEVTMQRHREGRDWRNHADRGYWQSDRIFRNPEEEPHQWSGGGRRREGNCLEARTNNRSLGRGEWRGTRQSGSQIQEDKYNKPWRYYDLNKEQERQHAKGNAEEPAILESEVARVQKVAEEKERIIKALSSRENKKVDNKMTNKVLEGVGSKSSERQLEKSNDYIPFDLQLTPNDYRDIGAVSVPQELLATEKEDSVLRNVCSNQNWYAGATQPGEITRRDKHADRWEQGVKMFRGTKEVGIRKVELQSSNATNRKKESGKQRSNQNTKHSSLPIPKHDQRPRSNLEQVKADQNKVKSSSEKNPAETKSSKNTDSTNAKVSKDSGGRHTQSTEKIIGVIETRPGEQHPPAVNDISRNLSNVEDRDRIGHLYKCFLRSRYMRNCRDKVVVQYKGETSARTVNPFINQSIPPPPPVLCINTGNVLAPETEMRRNQMIQSLTRPDEIDIIPLDETEMFADKFVEEYHHLLNPDLTLPPENLRQLGLSYLLDSIAWSSGNASVSNQNAVASPEPTNSRLDVIHNLPVMSSTDKSPLPDALSGAPLTPKNEDQQNPLAGENSGVAAPTVAVDSETQAPSEVCQPHPILRVRDISTLLSAERLQGDDTNQTNQPVQVAIENTVTSNTTLPEPKVVPTPVQPIKPEISNDFISRLMKIDYEIHNLMKKKMEIYDEYVAACKKDPPDPGCSTSVDPTLKKPICDRTAHSSYQVNTNLVAGQLPKRVSTAEAVNSRLSTDVEIAEEQTPKSTFTTNIVTLTLKSIKKERKQRKMKNKLSSKIANKKLKKDKKETKAKTKKQPLNKTRKLLNNNVTDGIVDLISSPTALHGDGNVAVKRKRKDTLLVKKSQSNQKTSELADSCLNKASESTEIEISRNIVSCEESSKSVKKAKKLNCSLSESESHVTMQSHENGSRTTKKPCSPSESKTDVTKLSNKVSSNCKKRAKLSHSLSESDSDLSLPQQESKAKTIDFTAHSHNIYCLKVYEKSVLAGCGNGNLYLYAVRNGDLTAMWEAHSDAIMCLAIHNNTVITGSRDATLKVFSIPFNKVLKEVAVGTPIQSMDKRLGNLYVGTMVGEIIRYDVNTMAIVNEPLRVASCPILAIKAAKEGVRNILIVAAKMQAVTIRDAKTGLLLRTLGWCSTIQVLQCFGESPLVYCGTTDQGVITINFINGEEGLCYNVKGVTGVAVLHDLLFVACYDGNVYIYTLQSTDHLSVVPGPGGILTSLAVCKNKIIFTTAQKRMLAVSFPDIVKRYLIDRATSS